MPDTVQTNLETSRYEAFFLFDVEQAAFHVAVLLLAYVIALPIGLERSRTGNGLGLRTVSIVSVSCCALSLIAFSIFDDQNAQSKILYGVLTGIGFIGGGALFRSSDGVYGTASAASVWTSAAVGIATSLALIEIALVLSLITTLTLYFCSRPERDSDPNDQKESDVKKGVC